MQELLARIFGGQVAETITSKFEGDLTKLYRAEKEELTEIEGVDEETADKIKAVVEFSELLYSKQAKKEAIKVNSKEKTAEYVMARLSHKEQEHFMVIVLDKYYNILGEELISLGGTMNTLCEPKNVFRKAIRIGGSQIILAHNHPSGDLNFSKNDILTTLRIANVGSNLGIRVVDHIIVGNGEYDSFFSYSTEEISKMIEDLGGINEEEFESLRF